MKESRTRNAALNAFSVTLNRVVGLLVPFVLRTIIIKVMGEQYLGLNNLFSSILQVLSLADLGFSTAIVYSMYEPIVKGDEKQICALLYLYKIIYRIIGIAVLVTGIILLPFLPKLINGVYPQEISIHVLYLMYLSNTVISYLFFADRKSLLAAHQKSYFENNINSICQFFFDVVKIVLLFLTKNYYFYVVFLPITTLVSSTISGIYSYKVFPQYRARGQVSKQDKKEILKKVSALSIQKFGNTISTSLDNIIVSSSIGLTAVAIYGNYFYIVSSLLSFLAGIISSSTAGIGNSMASQDMERNYVLFKKINMLNQWMLVWSVPCLVVLYQHFMKMWVGESLMLGFSFVLCMVTYYYIAESRRVVQVFKDAAGMWWEDKWKPLVGCIVNLVFNIVTVRYWGVYGVILSTVISYLFIELPWETIVLFKKYFKCKLMNYIKQSIQYLTVILLVTILSSILCKYISIEGIIGFFVKGIIAFFISNLIFVFTFRYTEEFKGLLEMIMKIIPKWNAININKD